MDAGSAIVTNGPEAGKPARKGAHDKPTQEEENLFTTLVEADGTCHDCGCCLYMHVYIDSSHGAITAYVLCSPPTATS